MQIDLRHRLIEAMFEAIYTKGYHASNLNAILKDVGTSKGGMYHYFSSKKELTLCAIDEVLNRAIEELWEKPLLEEEREHTLTALTHCINDYATLAEDENAQIKVEFGCPLNNMIQELSVIDDDFASALQLVHGKWHEIIVHTLQKAKDRGECRSDFDIYDVALFIMSAIEGSISSAKVFQDISYYKQSTKVLNHYILAL